MKNNVADTLVNKIYIAYSLPVCCSMVSRYSTFSLVCLDVHGEKRWTRSAGCSLSFDILQQFWQIYQNEWPALKCIQVIFHLLWAYSR